MALATLPTRLDELRFEIPEPLEAMSNPATVNDVNCPTEVMLGWEACEITKATLALATFPTKLEELRFEIPEPLEANKRPLTVNVVETVPTLVMLGCEA